MKHLCIMLVVEETFALFMHWLLLVLMLLLWISKAEGACILLHWEAACKYLNLRTYLSSFDVSPWVRLFCSLLALVLIALGSNENLCCWNCFWPSFDGINTSLYVEKIKRDQKPLPNPYFFVKCWQKTEGEWLCIIWCWIQVPSHQNLNLNLFNRASLESHLIVKRAVSPTCNKLCGHSQLFHKRRFDIFLSIGVGNVFDYLLRVLQ